MIVFYRNILLIIFFFIINCSEKTYHSGKIIDNKINYKQITSKEQLISTFGNPAFIDVIGNKYYYYSETKIMINFYNQEIKEREIYIFGFDINDEINFYDKSDLDDENKIKISRNITENNMIKRGLIEKIFGGIGKGPLPNANK